MAKKLLLKRYYNLRARVSLNPLLKRLRSRHDVFKPVCFFIKIVPLSETATNII